MSPLLVISHKYSTPKLHSHGLLRFTSLLVKLALIIPLDEQSVKTYDVIVRARDCPRAIHVSHLGGFEQRTKITRACISDRCIKQSIRKMNFTFVNV